MLDVLDALPSGFSLRGYLATETLVSATTIVVVLAAGAAGMLVIETRACVAVGVAISVMTIPVSACLGFAAGLGELSSLLSRLAVLGANIVMMLIGGLIVLAMQGGVARTSRGGSGR